MKKERHDWQISLFAPSDQASREFLQGMMNRMAVSFHKYGDLQDNYPAVASAFLSLTARLEEYEQTGNTEFLIDVANFAMIEYMRPSHVKGHFKATDSHESPGLTLVDGRVVHTNPLSDTPSPP